MAAAHGQRKPGFGVVVAAWLSVVFGAYGVLGVASLWGFLAGAGSAALGLLVSVAVLSERPVGRTRRVATIGLVLSALAVVGAAALAVVFAVSEA